MSNMCSDIEYLDIDLLIRKYPSLWDPDDINYGCRSLLHDCQKQLLNEINAMYTRKMPMLTLQTLLKKFQQNIPVHTWNNNKNAPKDKNFEELIKKYPALWDESDMNFLSVRVKDTCRKKLLEEVNEYITPKITMDNLKARIQLHKIKVGGRRKPLSKYDILQRKLEKYPALMDPKAKAHRRQRPSVIDEYWQKLLEDVNAMFVPKLSMDELKLKIKLLVSPRHRLMRKSSQLQKSANTVGSKSKNNASSSGSIATIKRIHCSGCIENIKNYRSVGSSERTESVRSSGSIGITKNIRCIGNIASSGRTGSIEIIDTIEKTTENSIDSSIEISSSGNSGSTAVPTATKHTGSIDTTENIRNIGSSGRTESIDSSGSIATIENIASSERTESIAPIDNIRGIGTTENIRNIGSSGRTESIDSIRSIEIIEKNRSIADKGNSGRADSVCSSGGIGITKDIRSIGNIASSGRTESIAPIDNICSIGTTENIRSIGGSIEISSSGNSGSTAGPTATKRRHTGSIDTTENIRNIGRSGRTESIDSSGSIAAIEKIHSSRSIEIIEKNRIIGDIGSSGRTESVRSSESIGSIETIDNIRSIGTTDNIRNIVSSIEVSRSGNSGSTAVPTATKRRHNAIVDIITEKKRRHKMVPEVSAVAGSLGLRLAVCRICLNDKEPLAAITDPELQRVYQKLTLKPFKTSDGRPMVACRWCMALLRKSQKLMVDCLQADEWFTYTLAGMPFNKTVKASSEQLSIVQVSSIMICSNDAPINNSSYHGCLNNLSDVPSDTGGTGDINKPNGELTEDILPPDVTKEAATHTEDVYEIKKEFECEENGINVCFVDNLVWKSGISDVPSLKTMIEESGVLVFSDLVARTEEFSEPVFSDLVTRTEKAGVPVFSDLVARTKYSSAPVFSEDDNFGDDNLITSQNLLPLCPLRKCGSNNESTEIIDLT